MSYQLFLQKYNLHLEQKYKENVNAKYSKYRQNEEQTIEEIKDLADEINELMTGLNKIEKNDRNQKKSQSFVNYFKKGLGWDVSSIASESHSQEINLINPEKSKANYYPGLHYLKPTGKVKNSTIHHIRSQIEQELREESELQKYHNNQNLEKFYKKNTPLYEKSKATKKNKQQLANSVRLNRQSKQMEGITFHPKINQAKQLPCFEERQKKRIYQKEVKQSKIIKEMIKGQTFKPKINTAVDSESIVKKIWRSNSPNKQKGWVDTQYNNQSFDSLPEKEKVTTKLKLSAINDLLSIVNTPQQNEYN